MLPEEAMKLLADYCDVEVNPEDRGLERSELLTKVRGRDAVISLLTDKIDDEVFQAAGTQCKIFANYAVGFNNVDLEAATKRGVVITNTPDVLTDATADLAWTLLFATARRVIEAEKFLREGQYKGWGPMLLLGLDITGKTLGIIGSGRIGSNFASKAKGFQMKILYNDIAANSEFEAATGGVFTDKESLLQQADFVSLHVPLLPSTHHLMSDKEFAMMKKTAILINTSRGPVVDEKALARALKNGEIWGAGLDVFENEPAVDPDLLKCANTVLLPHVASATIETRTNMGLIAVRNILNIFSGKDPITCVNPSVLK
jgi:lactate dehydrogenase-like 2-hydroxyacid dehydrogenase